MTLEGCVTRPTCERCDYSENAVSNSIHTTAVVVSIGALAVSAFSLTICRSFRDVGLPEA